jgi:glutaconate CoA-transferase subunit A
MPEGKVTTRAEVVAGLPDGTHVGLGGFSIARNVVAFVHELIRQGKRDLVVSQTVGGMDTDLLVGAGAVRKLIYSTGSLDRFGPLGAVHRARDAGTIEAEPYSGLTMALRHLAGSLGVPFLPTYSLLGSDILRELAQRDPPPAREITCPFTGRQVVLVSALQPEVAVIHANAADADGNAFVSGPTWDMKEMAHAARQVVVTAERLVGPEFAAAHPEATTIPGLRVQAVVEVPFGAYPTSVFGEYDYDAEHLRRYAGANRSAEGQAEYIRQFVLETGDHWEYLERSGDLRRLHALRRQAAASAAREVR